MRRAAATRRHRRRAARGRRRAARSRSPAPRCHTAPAAPAPPPGSGGWPEVLAGLRTLVETGEPMAAQHQPWDRRRDTSPSTHPRQPDPQETSTEHRRRSARPCLWAALPRLRVDT
ncbi:hypothetical protein FHG89_04085 [Micromonospora orduensis]|uniref:Uncharacterized protein n=1 Tax=Micromonospora orduensis TaxID=1420891 RepID=A0A5C4QYJ2_9ACTN|nr:hypothetical protein FHG89_04085 [Micromonospora orduensis]